MSGLSLSVFEITTLQPPSGPPFFLPKMDQAFRLDSALAVTRNAALTLVGKLCGCTFSFPVATLRSGTAEASGNTIQHALRDVWCCIYVSTLAALLVPGRLV